MRTFILTGNKNHEPIMGGWLQVMHHAKESITDNQNLILKLYKARAGENHARLIIEITRDGIREIENGHQPTIKSLLAE